jgi:hypothetical protein
LELLDKLECLDQKEVLDLLVHKVQQAQRVYLEQTESLDLQEILETLEQQE